ncbi:hypothetical protein GWK08_00140 [Leptobacterium flavescens]|uniref:Uncharacterized protein n=1 Tax=Leptobacterium flavescens TaxID=472055 RepID=A0A6P0UIU9_9FLAO|nr:hypothetical protein [Leptobacterium flavescens]NER11838.1 hypothetical protein [Leptobacterium flavescens]
MKKIQLIFKTLILLVFGFSGAAQNNIEIATDKKQIAINENVLERDIKELELFKSNSLALQTSVGVKDLGAAVKYRNILLASMKREIGQGEVKVARAKAEVAQSSREVKTDRREKRRNRRQYTGSSDDNKDIVRDRVNTRDDRRDRRDDVADLEELELRLMNQRVLYEKMSKVTFASADQIDIRYVNKELIKKFIATMEADVKETREELKEDRRELREDKRERRDDRRERREKY